MSSLSKSIGSTPGLPPLPGLASVTTAALAGLWEGHLGKGVLILDLRDNGTASIHLRRRIRAIYHPCTWQVRADAIHLICNQAQQVTFPILAMTEDTLVLRIGFDSVDTCQLQRSIQPANPIQP